MKNQTCSPVSWRRACPPKGAMRKAVAYSLQLTVICLLVSIIIAGLFYGMIAEVEIRELKADKQQWRMILCDRASAERAAEKDNE